MGLIPKAAGTLVVLLALALVLVQVFVLVLAYDCYDYPLHWEVENKVFGKASVVTSKGGTPCICGVLTE